MPDRCIDIFRALSDITRQEILEILERHERCVNELCREFERMTQPTISHHLHILKQCGLVSTRREGKMIYYSINKRVLRNGFEEFIARFDIEVL